MPKTETILSRNEVIGGTMGLIIAVILSVLFQPGIIVSFFLGFGLTTSGLFYGYRL